MKEVKTRKINIKFENAKELIKMFINSDVKINWGAEVKISSKLLSQFPEIEFWREFSLGVVKFDSLCVFLNEIHNKRLQDEYQLYLAAKSMNKKETFILDSAPIIEIKNIKKKPKNILEFVDN
jgi:hypothetical protein